MYKGYHDYRCPYCGFEFVTYSKVTKCYKCGKKLKGKDAKPVWNDRFAKRVKTDSLGG